MMRGDNNAYAGESKSNCRRSSILKRQDSCMTTEVTDGNNDCQRTPRRVSFAKLALVRYMHHLGDESSSACSSSDSSSGSSQSMGHDSMFLPDPGPSSQAKCEGELGLNTSLTEEYLSASPVDQPHVLVKAINTLLTDVEVNPNHSSLRSSESENKTIYYTSMNMSTSDTSQISNIRLNHDEIGKRCFSVRQQEAQNRTILFTDIDEDGCFMDITSNISMSESLHQQRDENSFPDDFSRKVELQNKPGLNRRPSFADEGICESRDDQAFMKMRGNDEHKCVPNRTIIFQNTGEDMESTQNLTKSVSIPYPYNIMNENLILKPKPKLLDNLFELFKTQEPLHVAKCKNEEIVSSFACELNSEHKSDADCTIIFQNAGEDMESTQNLTNSFNSVPYPGNNISENLILNSKPQLLDNLPLRVAKCKTEETISLDAEDMEITGEFSHVVPRSALSDITKFKGLTPVQEMSLVSPNNSLTDQENCLPSNALIMLQTGSHISKLNQVCTRLEETYGVHCNSASVKPHIVYEKSTINLEDKENCLIHSSIFKPCNEKQTVIVPSNLHVNSVHVEISSQSALVKENTSYGNKKMTKCQTTSSNMEQKTRENNVISMALEANENSGVSVSNSEPNIFKKKHKAHQDLKTVIGGIFEKKAKLYKQVHKGRTSSTIIDEGNTFYQIGEDLNNSQMEMTQGLSRTIFLGDKGTEDTSKVINKCNTFSQIGKDLNNSHMEMTQGLSRTIFLGGKGTEDASKVIDKCNTFSQIGKDLNNSHMEMTQGLSRTILLGGKGTEDASKVIDKCNTFSQIGKDLNDSHMEMTQGLSRTIFLGDKGTEDTSKVINECKTSQTGKDLNDSHMEMTQGLSRTILLGGKGTEDPSKVMNESNAFSRTSKDLNHSHMAMTEGVSRTLFLGGKGTSNPSKVIDECNTFPQIGKDLNNSHMEMTQGLSRTILLGGKATDNPSKVINESNAFSRTSKDLSNSHMEMTQGLSRTIFLGGKGTEFPVKNVSENNQCFDETNEDLNKSLMEVAQGVSKTFFAEGMNSECQMSECQTHDNSVVQQSLEYELEVVNSLPNQFENTSKISLKDCENKQELDTKVTNVQKNAAPQPIDEKYAARQALRKDIGLPLLLPGISAAFDSFHRRKSHTVDIVYSRGNEARARKDHISNSFVNTNKTMSFVSKSRESASKCFSSVDYTDPNDNTFRAMRHPNAQSTFIYEHMGSASCLEKFGKPESTEEAVLKMENTQSDTGFPVNLFDSIIPSVGSKLNAVTPSYLDKYTEDLDLPEMLSHQEMPELTEDTIDFKLDEGSSECREDASLMSDIASLSKNGKKYVQLEDVYESLGIIQLERKDIKNVPVQIVPATTIAEKLIATAIDVTRLCCLKQHVNETEAEINWSKQVCTERLMQFLSDPPDTLVALQSTECMPDLRTKAQEMIQSCRLSAQAKWKQQKTSHLKKFSHELWEASNALKVKIESAFSDTQKVFNLIANIDQSLKEMDMICGQKQELIAQEKELEETERETRQLKALYVNMDESVASLIKMEKESAELTARLETVKADTVECFSFFNSFVEWTVVRKTEREIHFGFLFNTLILGVDLADCGSFPKKISRVFLQSRLGGKSKSWAKLAHSLAVSCINCDKLQSLYKNYDQMHKLLADVSSIVCDSRQFSTELRLAHLKHGLFIDDNRLMMTVSNRKTRQKIRVDATVSWNSHPQSPLSWTVTTLFGSILSHDVKSTIDRIKGGPKYITRVLSQIEQLLTLHKAKGPLR